MKWRSFRNPENIGSDLDFGKEGILTSRGVPGLATPRGEGTTKRDRSPRPEATRQARRACAGGPAASEPELDLALGEWTSISR